MLQRMLAQPSVKSTREFTVRAKMCRDWEPAAVPAKIQRAMALPDRIELSTSPLPMECSTKGFYGNGQPGKNRIVGVLTAGQPFTGTDLNNFNSLTQTTNLGRLTQITCVFYCRCQPRCPTVAVRKRLPMHPRGFVAILMRLPDGKLVLPCRRSRGPKRSR
jgi:hypothetical protein